MRRIARRRCSTWSCFYEGVPWQDTSSMEEATKTMKKIAFSTLCVVVLITGPVAAMDDSYCDQLNKVLSGAPAGFSALKGKARKGEVTMWSATETIPGGEDCVVVGNEPPSYMCTLYEGDDDATKRSTYDDQVQWIGTCLGKTWKGREKADAELTEHTFSRGPKDATVRVRSAIGDQNAFNVQLWIDSPAS